ncbi:unnamed protein product [Boreogadus saida]
MATTLQLIGGKGGGSFIFTGRDNGATLKKIGVAVGDSYITAVRAELTDGRVHTFGHGQGFSDFTFKPNEIITELILWGNGAGTRLGGIKFSTSSGNMFFEHMAQPLKTEHHIDVGSGVCLGLKVRSGTDIDSMGFIFINDIQSSVLTDLTYPSLATYTPQVNKEYIKSHFYHNGTATDQEQKSTYSRSLTKSTTWSTAFKIESSVSLSVTARIPDVFETSSGFGMTLGVEKTSSTTKEETKKIESEEVNVTVPAGKTVSVEFSIGRAVIDLPFSATVKITCLNGSELEFKSTGNYNGVAFTAVDVKTTESDYVKDGE